MGPQILIIKLANFLRKSMKSYYQIPENWMKLLPIFWPNPEKIDNKIGQFDNKFLNNSCTTPWLKLRENHWKVIINSWKINENQWNLNQILAKIELFLNEIHIKLTQNLAQNRSKVIQKFERCKSLEGSSSDTKILML